MLDETITPVTIEPRYPRLLSVMRWFQRHALLTIAIAASLMGGVLVLDLLTSAEWTVGGFYLVPLALIALTCDAARSSSPASWPLP